MVILCLRGWNNFNNLEEEAAVIYGSGTLYRILDKYIENDMDETEHGFIMEIKWPDDYALGKCSARFWNAIQEEYDITVTEYDIQNVTTVGDLKKMICYQAG